MIEIRFRDIDPDTGEVSQDRRICLCESERMKNWVLNALLASEEDSPNREIYAQDYEK
jgi:hypothetical protein